MKAAIGTKFEVNAGICLGSGNQLKSTFAISSQVIRIFILTDNLPGPFAKEVTRTRIGLVAPATIQHGSTYMLPRR